MELDDVYDDLAFSSSSSSSESDEDYDANEETPSEDEVRESSSNGRERKAAPEKGSHNKENEKPLNNFVVDLLKGGEKKVTVEQCKAYLRAHGLRLAGTKQVLVDRIKEHLQAQEDDGDLDKISKSFLNQSCEVSEGSTDIIPEDLIKSLANVDLDNGITADIIEAIKDGKGKNKLTVENCKAYLREHGLRLSGTKEILIDRIKEHLRIKDGNGMIEYPEHSFTINCQGDSCTGDVVLFKQRVYDFFNIGGRCSAGPPVGVRTVAGRIIKESYGAAKQQHTFTVEVLWSTGDRPLPPLHPLIIKGRNLYRVKTLRQAWPDEELRRKQLQEKHLRGATARERRRVRLQGTKEAITDKEKTFPKTIDDTRSHVTYQFGNNGIRATSVFPPDIRDRKLQDVSKTSALFMRANKIEPDSQTNYLMNAQNVEPIRMTSTFMCAPHNETVSSIELRFNSSLAGKLIGTHGANIKEVRQVSKAEMKVDINPAYPDTCIVKIKGTAQQMDVAMKMVHQKVCCKFVKQNVPCRFGETCKFSHVLPGCEPKVDQQVGWASHTKVGEF